MKVLSDAGEALRRTTGEAECPPSARILERGRAIRRRRAFVIGGFTVAMVAISVAASQMSSDAPSNVQTAGPDPASTEPGPGPSDPGAVQRCAAAQQERTAQVVAAFASTAGEVDSWVDSGGPSGSSVASSWTSGLAPDARVSVCYVDGPFRVGGLPDGGQEDPENRSVSFVDESGRQVTIAIGPIGKLPIQRP